MHFSSSQNIKTYLILLRKLIHNFLSFIFHLKRKIKQNSYDAIFQVASLYENEHKKLKSNVTTNSKNLGPCKHFYSQGKQSLSLSHSGNLHT